MKTETMEFWRLFKAKSCSVKLKGKTKEEVFEELVSNLVKAGELPEELSDPAQRALLEREQLASTGVGRNVAIPHVALAGLDRAVVSLSLQPEGVDWDAVDGEPVFLLFLVLRPEKAGEGHNPDQHLEMMRWIAQICRDSDFRRFGIAAKTKTELVALLKEMTPT